jgi:CoA:oxalate CoA-transferase
MTWANPADGSEATIGSRRAPGSPLEDIRVLDLSQAVSGPYSGRALADLGAEVVKVGWADADVSNRFGVVRGGMSGLFVQMNAGKRGLSLDLASPESRELLRRLAAKADVIIENFRPGVLDRAALGYPDLSAVNPGLVMLSISGFGRTSPEAGRRAFAPVIHAESALLHRQADLDHIGAPSDLALSLADILAALHGAVAVLAAIIMRARTGQGQHIDLSMLEAMVASDDYAHYALDGAAEIYPQRGYVWDAPGGPIMISADPKALWASLGELIGGDKDATSTESLEVKIARRRTLIGGWIRGCVDRAALIGALDEVGLAWGEVRTMATLFESPTLQALRTVSRVSDQTGGERAVVRMPYRFSDAVSQVRGPAPTPGQHDRDVLIDWLGINDELTALAADGTVRHGWDSANERSE